MRIFSKFIALGIVALAVFSLSQPVLAQSAKIQVNDSAITENQISQRSKLLKLERRGASNQARRKMAQEQLIAEALQFQEARRLQIQIDSAGIDQAYAGLAKAIRMNSGRLTQVLNASGVQSKTLRDRLHAAALWREVIRTSIRKDVQVSEKEIIDALGEDTKQQVTTFDYLLKEVVFFMPKGSSQKSQMAQARTYKKNFAGCESAVELSLGYKDAGVRTIGRRHSTQFPEALATELSKTPIGGITAPRVTKKGIQLLAVCAKTEARDVTFVSNDKRNEIGNEKLVAAAKARFDKLRETATIVYR